MSDTVKINNDIIQALQKNNVFEAIVIYEDEKMVAITRLAAEGHRTAQFSTLLELINALMLELNKGGAK